MSTTASTYQPRWNSNSNSNSKPSYIEDAQHQQYNELVAEQLLAVGRTAMLFTYSFMYLFLFLFFSFFYKNYQQPSHTTWHNYVPQPDEIKDKTKPT